MEPIDALARKYDIVVVEDAAQGVNSTYQGAYLGTLGQLGAYSFHATKNFSCGEGGALVIRDEEFIERAEIIREKGTNRSRSSRTGRQVHLGGSRFLICALGHSLAAALFGQLQHIEEIHRAAQAGLRQLLRSTRAAREGRLGDVANNPRFLRPQLPHVLLAFGKPRAADSLDRVAARSWRARRVPLRALTYFSNGGARWDIQRACCR